MSTSHAPLHPLTGRPPFPSYLQDLRDRREFILTMPRHELKAQNVGTVLGNLWFLLDPALSTLTYFIIFGLLLEVDRGVDNYITFLVVGVMLFRYFSGSVTGATRVIHRNEALIRSIHFPRAALPLSASIADFYKFLPGLAMVLIVALATGERIDLEWLALPFVIANLALFVTGGVFICARWGHRMPDLHSLLPHVTRLGFYSSGTLYDPSRFTENERVLFFFDINPMYQFLSLTRWAITDMEINNWFFLTAPLWSISVFVFGFVWFWRAENTYGAAA